ncbi:hypothetical protein [Micromonospora sp. S4605]|uniref:hypothetical protein n=1 Tax=Micromonospora sp. S4605 TaxID=1420897 RepID=UPI0013052617|nr:hypothetical protein [Micromonospora sp. S4605]
MEQQINPSDVGRYLARKRWDKATPEQRKAQGEALAAGRRKARAKRSSEQGSLPDRDK